MNTLVKLDMTAEEDKGLVGVIKLPGTLVGGEFVYATQLSRLCGAFACPQKIPHFNPNKPTSQPQQISGFAGMSRAPRRPWQARLRRTMATWWATPPTRALWSPSAWCAPALAALARMHAMHSPPAPAPQPPPHCSPSAWSARLHSPTSHAHACMHAMRVAWRPALAAELPGVALDRTGLPLGACNGSRRVATGV